MASKVVTKQFSTGTSSGNVNFTHADVGGTPNAIIVFATIATTSATEADHMSFCMGFADATREGSLNTQRADAQANTQTEGRLSTGEVLRIGNKTSDLAVGTFSAFISNGVTLNFASAPSGNYLFSITFFVGDEVSVYMDNTSFPSDADFDITAPGFQPDLVYGGWISENIVDSDRTNGEISFGVSDGTTQIGFSNYSAHFVGTSDPRANRHSDVMNTPDSHDQRLVNFTTFDANGFTASKAGSSFGVSGYDFMYLAVAFSDANIWVGALDSPTATGDWAKTDPGFQPQHVMLCTNMLQSLDSVITTSDAGAFGISIFDEDGDEISHNWTDEDAVTTSNTSSLLHASQAIDFNDDSQSQVFAATYSSMDANGWTLNFSVADGTARKWWGVAIESVAALPDVAINEHIIETQRALLS